jgi:hypothetical protein
LIKADRRPIRTLGKAPPWKRDQWKGPRTYLAAVPGTLLVGAMAAGVAPAGERIQVSDEPYSVAWLIFVLSLYVIQRLGPGLSGAGVSICMGLQMVVCTAW